MKAPAFQFYAADFMMGTCAMTAEEVGAYIRLLCVQWDQGFLPNDDGVISRLGGCSGNAVAILRTKFEVGEDGKLRNARLETERAKQRAYREKQAINGGKRWENHAKPHAVAKPSHVPSDMPNTCSPSSSTSSIVKEATPPCAKAPKQKVPRARDALLDALVSLNGENPIQVTGTAWGKAAKALHEIREVCPEVTPEEIRRRATNYVLKWPGKLTSTGLSAHWAEFDKRPPMLNFNGQPIEPTRMNIVGEPRPDIYVEPPAWREKFTRQFPDMVMPDSWDGLSATLRNSLIQK